MKLKRQSRQGSSDGSVQQLRTAKPRLLENAGGNDSSWEDMRYYM